MQRVVSFFGIAENKIILKPCFGSESNKEDLFCKVVNYTCWPLHVCVEEKNVEIFKV